jgi:hypothetical protein
MSIFEGDIFAGPRRGMYGGGALGVLPSGTRPIAELAPFREQFPGLPTSAELSSKGATYFTNKGSGDANFIFTFFDSTGRLVIGPSTVWRPGQAPVEPVPTKGEATPARYDTDGLLPTSTTDEPSAPQWLPWVLVGGGVLVAGGIVYAATRKSKKPVAANRRRRRRSSRRRRRSSR